MNKEWLIWEVFVCSKQGFDYKYCGSLYVVDVMMVLCMVCDVYMCCQEGVSIWVVLLLVIIVLDLSEKVELFELVGDKIYCYLMFYMLFDEVNYM